MGCTSSSNAHQNHSTQDPKRDSSNSLDEKSTPFYGLAPTMSVVLPAVPELFYDNVPVNSNDNRLPLEAEEAISANQESEPSNINAVSSLKQNLQPSSHFGSEIDQDFDTIDEEDISNLSSKEFYAARLRRIWFLQKLEVMETTYSYEILVDASVLMFNQEYNTKGETVFDFRWTEAQKIVSSLVPKVTRCDLKGATVVFFSDNKRSFSHSDICTSEKAAALFSAKKNQFRGGRHLHGPLHRIMTDKSDSRPAVILVLLSDLPNDADKVHKLLLSFTAATSATKKRVTVSFVQVGGKAAMSATLDAWMKLLSTEKTLKSIVDVTTFPSLRDAWFSDVLAKHF